MSFLSNSVIFTSRLAGKANDFSASLTRYALRKYVSFASSSEDPVIYINSIPKAGTHLLTTELIRLGLASNSWLHIKTKWVNQTTEKRIPLSQFEIDLNKFNRLARTVPNGTFFSSHLPYSTDLDSCISQLNYKSLFIIRDPRDILVSNYFYILRLKRHPAHNFLMSLPDDTSRYRALLYGHPAYKNMEPISNTYIAFSKWTTSSNVLTVKFEDIIGASGGGSDPLRCETLKTINNYIHPANEKEISTEELLDTHRKSATFRSGKISTWKESVPKNLVTEIQEALAPSVALLGYTN